MTATSRPKRGAATLLVVMVLFFLMMLAVGYNGRSLVFEQKTSANQYRYTQAFEAGEAGLQWALSMLNSGAIDANCRATSHAGHTTFRERYLTADVASGRFVPRQPNASAACIKQANGWACSCPSSGEPSVARPVGTAGQPMFVVRFEETSQPGMVSVKASGCSSFGTQCTSAASERSDASVQVESLLALSAGLRTLPAAALSARDSVTFSGTGFQLTNTDPNTSGITVMTGGTIAGTPQAVGTPGSMATETLVAGDPSLSRLGERFFASFMGATPVMFQRLPTVRNITCNGDCTGALRQGLAAGYRAFWVNGALSMLDATLGTPTDPVLLVVNGNVQLGRSRVWGMVFSTATEWNTGSSSAQLHGAAMAQGSFAGDGVAHFVYDADVLARLHMRVAAFARVPGSWGDMP